MSISNLMEVTVKKIKTMAFALLMLANFGVFVGSTLAESDLECDVSTPVFDWAENCDASGSNCFKVRCDIE